MELINIYDAKRRKTDKIVDRYSYKKREDEFDLSVQIWIINNKNEILLTKRTNKKTFPNLWECTEGVVQSNETSLKAAIRELKEEIGIEILPSSIYKMEIDSKTENPKFTDVYVCFKDVKLNEIILDKEECCDVKIVDEQEYNKIIENKEIAYYYIRYFKELWEQAINITDIEQIRMLYQKFESSFDEEEKKQLQEKIDQIRTKGIMSDV